MHKLLRQLVRGGIKSGELTGNVAFLQQAITGLMIETMWVRGATPAPHLHTSAQELADFVLRGSLSSPDQLPHVRARALALLETPVKPLVPGPERSVAGAPRAAPPRQARPEAASQ